MKLPVIFAFILFSYSTSGAESALFDYHDFGPQVLAYEIIGYEWYQWQNTGGHDPEIKDSITVVVFWEESLETVKKRYPIRPENKKDYRYLTYDDAMEYPNRTISQFPEAENLIKTRRRLRHLRN